MKEIKTLKEQVDNLLIARCDLVDDVSEIVNNYNRGFITKNEFANQLIDKTQKFIRLQVLSEDYEDASMIATYIEQFNGDYINTII
jgi:hypothetical protein